MMNHIEPLEHEKPLPPRGRAGANAIAGIVVVAALLFGWRYLRPSSALASGDWLSDWDQAVEQSHTTGKPALVLFTANWCPACRHFESQTLSDPAVRKHLAEKFTLVVIDLTKQDGPNMKRAREFGVTGIPTLIQYDKSGQEKARAHGMSPNELLNWLR